MINAHCSRSSTANACCPMIQFLDHGGFGLGCIYFSLGGTSRAVTEKPKLMLKLSDRVSSGLIEIRCTQHYCSEEKSYLVSNNLFCSFCCYCAMRRFLRD